jgi:hypothetical protein
VGTTYFYWYNIHTGEHIYDKDGSDALTLHPPQKEMKDISYLSVDWHYSQLRDMHDAGLDFVMPVYWGLPGKYTLWSFKGIKPLVAAHDRMTAEHKEDTSKPLPPKIGLFYDTSIFLLNQTDGQINLRGEPIDLTTKFGREWFYVTIRDFFSLIPPAKWAKIDGKPIVFLYNASFYADTETRVFDFIRANFKADFGTDLFMVRNFDWLGRADAWYVWGGALGLTLGKHAAGIGPGYDHSAVEGREPVVVGRRKGQFYIDQWEKLLSINLKRRPWLIHVETWNEWHEGTSIARMREAKPEDLYMQITAKYAKMFRERKFIKIRRGKYSDAQQVRWSPSRSEGLILKPPKDDGFWSLREVKGVTGAMTFKPENATFKETFLYFDVDDFYMYDEENCSAEMAVTFLEDDGCDDFFITYDNNDPKLGEHDGSFRPLPYVKVGNTGQWRTLNFVLPNVRFSNRGNCADFRISVDSGKQNLTVSEVIVRKLTGQQ